MVSGHTLSIQRSLSTHSSHADVGFHLSSIRSLTYHSCRKLLIQKGHVQPNTNQKVEKMTSSSQQILVATWISNGLPIVGIVKFLIEECLASTSMPHSPIFLFENICSPHSPTK